MFQRTVENNRQEGDWLIPTHVEARNDTQQESQLPSTPLPLRFSDWSSLGSPHARTIPYSATDREVEQNVHIPNQLNVQSGTVPRHETSRTTAPEEVIIPLPSSQHIEEQGVHAIELEPNPLNRETRMQRDDVGMNRTDHVPIVQTSENMMSSLSIGDLTHSLNVPTEPENNSDIPRGSHVGTQEINLQEISGIPPVERLTSSKDRRVTATSMNIGQHYPHKGSYPQGMSTANRRDYPDDSSDDNRSY